MNLDQELDDLLDWIDERLASDPHVYYWEQFKRKVASIKTRIYTDSLKQAGY